MRRQWRVGGDDAAVAAARGDRGVDIAAAALVRM